MGKNHPLLASNYLSFGKFYLATNQTKKAVLYLKKGVNIDIKTFGESSEQILVFYELLIKAYYLQKDLDNSLIFTIKSAEIRRVKIGLQDVATQESISNANRLAKELGREGELPEWFSEI